MKMRGLYAIVDPSHLGTHTALDLTAKILTGGCAILQLRAKDLPDRDRLVLGRSMRALCHQHGVAFVMNDRLDLAQLAEADGVHLGQDDVPLLEARRLAPSMWIGVSTHSVAQAVEAERQGANILGFGPVFPTVTKENPDEVVGLTQLSEVVRAVRIPVVAIGGVSLQNASAVAQSGVPYAAVISALSDSADPRATAASLHSLLGELR